MSTVPAKQARREQPPPAPGTVEVRVHGAAADIEEYLRLVGEVLPLGRYTWRLRNYPARSGGGVLQYMKVNLPSESGA